MGGNDEGQAGGRLLTAVEEQLPLVYLAVLVEEPSWVGILACGQCGSPVCQACLLQDLVYNIASGDLASLAVFGAGKC